MSSNFIKSIYKEKTDTRETKQRIDFYNQKSIELLVPTERIGSKSIKILSDL